MFVGGLEMPAEYMVLVRAGRWPRTHADEIRQNIEPLVAEAVVRRLAPEESRVCLLSSPTLVADRATTDEREFWNDPRHDPDGIDFAKAVVFGDFGLGSDAPIVLDYRSDPPSVWRLRWSERGTENRWVLMSENFAAFVRDLGLWDNSPAF
jgi:hypothetical protein